MSTISTLPTWAANVRKSLMCSSLTASPHSSLTSNSLFSLPTHTERLENPYHSDHLGIQDSQQQQQISQSLHHLGSSLVSASPFLCPSFPTAGLLFPSYPIFSPSFQPQNKGKECSQTSHT